MRPIEAVPAITPDRQMLDRVRHLYAYHHWANQRLLDALEALTDEQRHRPVVSSFPSLMHTAGHIAGRNWVWLKRWEGSSPQALPAGWESLSFDQFRGVWSDLQGQQAVFLDSLTDERLASVLVYRNFAGDEVRGVLWAFMHHVVNHASYHRGQATTLIRQVGGTPVNTDLEQFIREHPDVA